MPCAVYWIRCADHTDMFSQGYIGVSKNVKRRFVEHQRKSQNAHLKNAIQKYGWDALVKTEILIAEESYCLDIEAKLRPDKNIGWNLVAGGGLPPVLTGSHPWLLGKPSKNKGMKRSVETRQKISNAVKLAMQNPERREINRQLLLGKPSLAKGLRHTDETRAKMGQAHRGKPSKLKGVPATPEKVAAMIAAARAYSWACPHCQTTGHGRGAATRWHFDKCKHKGVTNGH
jgi:predicted GIY-YIG superfamily endonuclease